jgi:hypothetical protein
MKNYIFFLTAIYLLLAFPSCNKDMDGSGEPGTGGSMARFTIKNNFLYAVDHESLHTFKLGSTIEPMGKQLLGFAIETIFPSGDLLFIGAQNGMHIYDIKNPDTPLEVSFTRHFVSYDPVVVNGDYAWVTLRTDETFGAGRNLLQVYDIRNIKNPQLITEYPMSGPRGLGVDGDKLFICDNMLKVYRITNGHQITLLQTFDIKAIDVIPKDNRLYVVAKDGFYQYHYEDDKVTFVSKITLPEKVK